MRLLQIYIPHLLRKDIFHLWMMMRIPARVAQWVKLTKMPLTSIQALVRFVQEFLFKVSATHTMLLPKVHYILSTLPH